MSDRYLIAGLGNPGKEYGSTRHNVGFMVIDALAERLQASLHAGKGEYRLSDPAPIPGGAREVVLLKPLTYMNNSGVAVREVVQYFKFELRHILIILDDFELPFGTLRIRAKGSDGGQKGLRSIIQHLGTNAFTRLRLGIGNALNQNATHFVLSQFSKAERQALPDLVEKAADAALDFCAHGASYAMNHYNVKSGDL